MIEPEPETTTSNPQIPLSPVLTTKKRSKNGQRSYKEKSCKILSQINNQNDTGFISNVNEKPINTDAGPSNQSNSNNISFIEETTVKDNKVIQSKSKNEEDIIERIKKLQELERSREEITALLSYDSNSTLAGFDSITTPETSTSTTAQIKLINHKDDFNENRSHFNENCTISKTGYTSGFSTTILKTENLPHTSLSNKPLRARTAKTVRDIFGEENFDDLGTVDFGSFKKASATCTVTTNECTNESEFKGFRKASVNNSEVMKNLIIDKNLVDKVLQKDNFDDLDVNKQFTGSNNVNLFNKIIQANIHTSQLYQSFNQGVNNGIGAVSTISNVFAAENFDDLKCDKLLGFQKASVNFQENMPLSKDNDEHVNKNGVTQSTNKTKKSAITVPFCIPSTSKASNFYKPLIEIKNKNVDETIQEFCGFRQSEINESDKLGKNLALMIKRLENKGPNSEKKACLEIAEIVESVPNGNKRKFSDIEPLANDAVDQPKLTLPEEGSFLKRPKKRLGCHPVPTIKISEASLRNALSIFGDLQNDCDTSTRHHTSTPIRNLTNQNGMECDVTPIQRRKNLYASNTNPSSRKLIIQHSNSWTSSNETQNKRCCLKKPTEGDIRWWIDNLTEETRHLEEKLIRFKQQQNILESHEKILEVRKSENYRTAPTEGILSTAKLSATRFPLKNLNNEISFESGSNFIWQINPQNAHLVHFFVDPKKESFVETSDGAKLVPNQQGKIGISEIQYGFETMEGISPNLLPNGWIKNHFRWIVWKLASYERMFNNQLGDCLNLENVIQQLKYRYEVEIDQVKRSALRKILENDDCSKRRIVLCVSKIVKTNTSYELELTDGWYAIKAMIDNPLAEQIAKEKICLGVKLMICGAELVGGTGCHPLELEAAVSYLKINFNSTRRCLWWTKLGYQKHSIPYLIPMSSINLDGGTIGRIKVYILRVYPLKYFEKCDKRNVWRNRRAAERQAQEMENQQLKEFERIESLFEEKNDVCRSKTNGCKITTPIKDIDDPQILYEILQSENEEALQELSYEQQAGLNQYIIEKSVTEKSKYLDTIKGKTKIVNKQTIIPLLKMKIIDYEENSKKIYDFYIWHPQDCYLQELCENESFTLFNVTCSSKWGLGTNRYTQFKKEPNQNNKKFGALTRKCSSITDLLIFSYFSPHFKDFDTVGIAIRKDIGDHQKLWLADTDGNLLLVSIFDSPKNILLLDIVEEGEIISMSNVIYKQSFNNYSFAVADHCTTCSKYPQNKYLQEAIRCLEENLLSKDLNSLLRNANEKIKRIEEEREKQSNNSNMEFNSNFFENDDMDCSQITTTDLALLECIDKLT